MTDHWKAQKPLHGHDLEKGGRKLMADRKKLLADGKWKEVDYINTYGVFMGYLSMAIKGSGFLVLTWTTVVLLGGFVSKLSKKDFWSLTFITLSQTAGIFDVSTNEKLRYMKKAGTGLVMGVCSCVVGGRARNSMPRFWLAAVLVAVQGVLFGVMLLPLALVYLAGILISGLLSLWRLIQQDFQDMSSNDREANLVPSLNTLYCIALVQCFIFCFRWILRCSRKTLAKRVATDDCDDSEIQLVYKYMSETNRGCEKDPTFVQGRNFITHAVDMIGSDSPADCIQGVQTLYTAICIAEKNLKAEEEDGGKESEDYREQRDIVRGQHMLLKHLVVSASSSEQVLQKLLETLNPRGAHDRETRNQAAKIVERLACSISLEQFPMGIQHISSLIGTLEEYSIAEPYVRDCLYDEFEKHWILEFGPSAASKPVEKDYKELLLCGLRILRRLAADGNNCRVMSDTPGLLTKIMAPVASDLLHSTTLRHGVWSDIVDGSMQVMAQLLFTADDLGEISIKLRDEISSCKQAISTLWMILNCNVCKEELKGRAIHILTRLCMDTKKQSSRRDDVTQKQSSNSSRYGFVRMLVSIFTHAGKYSSSMRAYAGEGLSLLSSRGEVVHIQEVRGLVQVLVRPDENKTCRQHAAEILEHLCTHYTKDDGRYHAELKKTMTDAMPMVTEQINSCLPTSHPPNNHEENVPRAVLLQPVRPATTLLSSLFSLYGTIYDTFITDLGLHRLEVAHQNKLKEMVVKTTLNHNHPTVQNLVLFKVISKLLISLMKHSGTFRFVQKEGINSFIVELSTASTKMRDLDYSMVFRCATSNSEFTSKLEGCTLASLVKELADMAALHSPASTLFSSPKKSSVKGRWKAKRKPVKPKLHSRKLPAKDKSWAPKRKYNPVEPFLTEDEIKNISWPCQKLHSYCLRVFRSQPGINLSIKHHHFNLSDGDLQIMVPWSDLRNLYSFKELNASLMRCWTLHLFRKCEDEGIPIGFMDPDLMSGQSIKADQNEIKNHVVKALVAHWEKDIILVAHYSVEYNHWITIALSPSDNRVTYFNCIKGQDWKKLIKFIDEAWSLARDEKGLKSKNCKLSHSFDDICSGKQVLVECGYYACHKMLLFVECNLPWKNLGQMSGNCDMKEIRNQLCDFFMDELDAMHAPRSFGSTPDFSPNKSERGNGKFSSNYAKFKNSFAEDKNGAPPALDKETEDDSYRIPEEDIAFSTKHLGFDHSDKVIEITVPWSDLCNLYNLEELDASLMRCWTGHLIEKCGKEQIEIGFLDPHVMSYQTIEGGSKENQSEETERPKARVLRYLARALLVQQDKRFILFAHNDYYHWITIAIIPSSSEVYYLDSKKKGHNWEKMQKFIDQAWAVAHADGPKLSHHFGFDCDQQTDNVKCGYYACHNMLLIAEWTLANKEGFPDKLGACNAEMVSSQLKKFLCMKIEAEKNKPASQANSAPPMEKEQASQSSSEPPKKSLKIKKKQE